jgi:ribulose-5-phosphate 4-epimerase/fuculose-1-phosphate aldolase
VTALAEEQDDRPAAVRSLPERPDLARRMLMESIGAFALVVAGCGAVTVGRDPDHAVDRLELVEVLCRTWRDALLIRAARVSLGIVGEPSPGPQWEEA